MHSSSQAWILWKSSTCCRPTVAYRTLAKISQSLMWKDNYVGWGCILNCFMLSSLPCFSMLFADLLSPHLVTFCQIGWNRLKCWLNFFMNIKFPRIHGHSSIMTNHISWEILQLPRVCTYTAAQYLRVMDGFTQSMPSATCGDESVHKTYIWVYPMNESSKTSLCGIQVVTPNVWWFF